MTFTGRGEWRNWLESHHRKADEAWLVLYKKGVREGSLSLDEIVEEALCFGWIDGKLRGLDKERYSLRFTPRRNKSVWSVSNIRRVERLIREGLMTESGMEKVVEARKSGQWDAAISREQTDVIPADLEKALRGKKGAVAGYRSLSNSRKKQLLHWLLTARRPDTRQRRIAAIVRETSE
jgi:uncharacterized protein YdeI (YjbR/CyaY-like superfamily)